MPLALLVVWIVRIGKFGCVCPKQQRRALSAFASRKIQGSKDKWRLKFCTSDSLIWKAVPARFLRFSLWTTFVGSNFSTVLLIDIFFFILLRNAEGYNAYIISRLYLYSGWSLHQSNKMISVVDFIYTVCLRIECTWGVSGKKFSIWNLSFCLVLNSLNY